MIAESEVLVLTLMTYLGQSPVVWSINSEIGDLGSLTAPTGNLFRFLRYDVRLEEPWLAQNLGKHFSSDLIAKLRQMDNPANMSTLYKLGQSAAPSRPNATIWRSPSSERGTLKIERKQRINRQQRPAAGPAFTLAGAVGGVGALEATALVVAFKARDQIPGGIGAAIAPAGARGPDRFRTPAQRKRRFCAVPVVAPDCGVASRRRRHGAKQ